MPAALIAQLAEGGYIERAENVLVVGDSGTGKTMLAIGLGVAACEQGRSVRFTTVAALVNELLEARDERTLARAVGRCSRYELMICDVHGYVTLPPTGAELRFQVLAQRAESGSVIITTNRPFSEWTTVFSDPRLCKAVIERLTYPHRGDRERLLSLQKFPRAVEKLQRLSSAKPLAAEKPAEARKRTNTMSDTSESEPTAAASSGSTPSEVSSPETSTTAPAGGAR